jgi:hypothetical protein
MMKGEQIYEYHVDFTAVTDYGVSLQAILSGEAKVPPQGARFDVAFEGRATGRLSGRVRGVDHLNLRADGRFELDIRATLETEDGQRIFLQADGVGLPRPGETVAGVSENVKLTTASADYAWVNARQIWAPGTVDLAAGKVHITAFMQ